MIVFQRLSQGRADLSLYHIALQSDFQYRVDRDKCDKHDDNGLGQYQKQRRRRRGGVIIVVARREGRLRRMG